MTNKILVTGGAGYIGSHMCKYLVQAGYEVVVIDSLVTGTAKALLYGEFCQVDLADREALRSVFREHKFAAIFHFAAFSLVAESMVNPAKYFQNNVTNCVNLLEVAREFACKNFIFSSTAAIFGEPEYSPIDENHPKNPINPYGVSKLIIEQILAEYSKAYDFNFVALRYFNAAGADIDGELGENHEPETHLIPIICQAITGKRDKISINGTDYNTKDGTCIRDYIHVYDLCNAHLLALNYLQKGGASECFNLGSGKGFSVKEIIKEAEDIIKTDYPDLSLNVSICERREGDPEILIADSKKAEEILNWERKYNHPRFMIEHCLKWEFKKNL